MSEEEKKAIKIIEEIHDMIVNLKLIEEKYTAYEIEKALYIVIMIIRKQQKEIEDLNEIKQQICNEELITQDYVQDNFIAKDKIRELLKSKDIELTGVISYRELEELLEENDE